MTAGFATTAPVYLEHGWHPFPLPAGQKSPPPNGITGADGKTPTPDDVEAWCHLQPGANVGLRLDDTVVGIDVDDYDDKHGAQTLAELETKYGPLPPTWSSTSREPGTTAIRFYRIPAGVIFPGIAGPDIEFIQHHHRYAVVAPSTHPDTGARYRWYTPDRVRAMAPPRVDELPALPDTWIEGLRWRPTEPTPASSPRAAGIPAGDDDSIAERINTDHHWHDVLTADGWHLTKTAGDSTSWTRPGKDGRNGISAVLHEPDGPFNVFTSSVPALQQPWAERNAGSLWSFSMFGYLAATRYHGDRSACARDYRLQQNAAALTTRTRARVTTTLDNEEPPRQKPSIIWNGRHQNEVVDEAIQALDDANHPPTLFVRSAQVARLREDEEHRPLIETVRPDHLRNSLADAATWWRALKDGGQTATSPPYEYSTAVLARAHWPFPPLAGVVELPLLRPDGTFVIEHGYDRATRLYHWHRGEPYAPIPDAPSASELAAAVALVDDILCDFPWDTSADRANAWALLLTPLVRAIVGQVPMALVDAPEPGTGKGLLIKVAATITIGRAAGLMAWPTSEEELEKKVTAALMSGATMIIFDNVEGMIRSSSLAAALTADTWQGRVLGRSEMISVANRATWAATGNNIDVGGDLARRCYRIRLDAHQAQPWLRTGFKHGDLERYVADHRPQLLHALCTIVRSWWLAGRQLATALPAMGGYSGWVRTVGGILDHAGINDFLGNLAEFHATADREAGAWESFLSAWDETLGEEPVTIGELLSKMKDIYIGHQLRDVLPDDLADQFEKPNFSNKLGHALRKRAGRHYGARGLHLVEMPRDRRRVAIYSVTDRSVSLFEGAGSLTDPAGDNAATCADASKRGICGISTTHFTREISEETHKNSQGPMGPEDPANPASRAPDELEPF